MLTLDEVIQKRITEKRAAEEAAEQKAKEARQALNARCADATTWLCGQIEEEYGFDTYCAGFNFSVTEQDNWFKDYTIKLKRDKGHIEAPQVRLNMAGNFSFHDLRPNRNGYWHAVLLLDHSRYSYCDFENLIDAIMYVDGINWREESQDEQD